MLDNQDYRHKTCNSYCFSMATKLRVYHLTANFFDRCPAHPNPLVRSIGNYSLDDLHHQYKKYIHKRPKHILL